MQLITLVISICRIYRGIVNPFHIPGTERGPSRTGGGILTYYSKVRLQRGFIFELRDHCDDHRVSAASVIHTSLKSSLRPLL